MVLMALVLFIGLLTGCAKQPTEPENGNGTLPPGNGNGVDYQEEVIFDQGYFRPSEQNLPEEIANWVEYSKEVEVVQEKEFEGYRYVLITMGMKPTGGYAVQVEEVIATEEELEIRMIIQEPLEGDNVTQAITYPYDLIIVEEEELPLRFNNTAVDSDEFQYYFGLHGIDEINRPFVASSIWIKIFSPEPNEQVKGTINLTGLANVYEGNVSYEIISGTGEVIATGYATGSMGDWGYFEEQIQIPQAMTGEIVLELYSESGEDGSKMFVVEIPLIVTNN